VERPSSASTRAIVGRTSSGSASGASGTNATPSAKPGPTDSATASPRRVLPVPGGPVSVTSRACPNNPASSASSRSRPTKLVNGRDSGAAAGRCGGSDNSCPVGAAGPSRQRSRKSEATASTLLACSR
jgi:hypothetical protein